MVVGACQGQDMGLRCCLTCPHSITLKTMPSVLSLTLQSSFNVGFSSRRVSTASYPRLALPSSIPILVLDSWSDSSAEDCAIAFSSTTFPFVSLPSSLLVKTGFLVVDQAGINVSRNLATGTTMLLAE